jgi:hypothetical protein
MSLNQRSDFLRTFDRGKMRSVGHDFDAGTRHTGGDRP